MSIRAQVEAIIYATEEPASVDQIAAALKDMVSAEELVPARVPGEDGDDLEIVPGDAESDAGSPQLSPAEFKTALRARIKSEIAGLIADYAAADRGMDIREVAGGYRMSTKPEQHDAVRAFARSLKAPVRLSLPALETLAVIAYKQPATAPEISEIRGVDASGVLATLLDRKLITTAGRKAVVGRPILYKTTKEFLLRFGLNDLGDLPSMEEFEKLIGDGQGDLFAAEAMADATGVPDLPPESSSQETSAQPEADHPQTEAIPPEA